MATHLFTVSKMNKTKTILVKESTISVLKKHGVDYISLTDIAKTKNSEEPKDVVKNWFRNRSTVEFLGLWEKINNPNFKGGSNSTPFMKNQERIVSHCHQNKFLDFFKNIKSIKHE